MAEGCRYDSAGPWNGGAACSGGFTAGARAAGEALVAKLGGSYQGYNCRPNSGAPSQLSVHGTGRAVDWFPPSRSAGDAGAAWLVENHEAFGVQLVIWWRRDWSCSRGWTSYGGPNPHTDHIHFELTIPAAANNTAATYQTNQGGLTVADIEELIKVIQNNGKLTRDKIDKQTREIDRKLNQLMAKVSDLG